MVKTSTSLPLPRSYPFSCHMKLFLVSHLSLGLDGLVFLLFVPDTFINIWIILPRTPQHAGPLWHSSVLAMYTYVYVWTRIWGYSKAFDCLVRWLIMSLCEVLVEESIVHPFSISLLLQLIYLCHAEKMCLFLSHENLSFVFYYSPPKIGSCLWYEC